MLNPPVRSDRHGRRSRRCRRPPPSRAARPTTRSAATATTATTAPTRGYVTDTINGNYKTRRRAQHVLGPLPPHDDGPTRSCIEAGGNTSYSEALRQAQAELARPRAAERPRLHRLPHRRRGQHRQRLQRERPHLSAGQPRRPAAVPHRDQPRQHLQGRRARRSTASATHSVTTSTARPATGPHKAQEQAGQLGHACAPACVLTAAATTTPSDTTARESRRSPRSRRSRRSPRLATSTTSPTRRS